MCQSAMKPSPRPSRLLNLNRSPALQKAMYATGHLVINRYHNLTIVHSAATNATTSLFLRLPAEIRERVYTYVLGSQVLHVGSGPIHHPHSVIVCTHGENYNEGPDGHISRFETRYPSLVQSIGKSTGHIESHSRCYNVPCEQTHNSLDLLFVCRQIYHEGACSPRSLLGMKPDPNPLIRPPSCPDPLRGKHLSTLR